MSDFKYNDTNKIKKANPLLRTALKRENKRFYQQQDHLFGDILNINGYPLDSVQREVVFSEDKYTMVIAAAGSGKTTTIIGKIKYLIKAKSIKPEDIIAISFTNESVNSLKESLIKNEVSGINVYTFHKLALSFINKPSIINDDYLEYVIKEYLLSNYYTEKRYIIQKAFKVDDYEIIIRNVDKYIKNLVKIINLCHTADYKTRDFIKVKNSILKKIFFKKCSLLSMLYLIMDLYFLFQEEKNATNSIDFDDMLIEATKRVSSFNLNYKYIIVDEYQDTSLIRVRFLQELINKSNAKLLVVGDDYQSIYRFNGCDINIFLNFKKYFSNPKTIKLINTYRNSQELINISKHFILKNPFQIKKRIRTIKRLKNPIKLVYYYDFNQKSMLIKLLDYINRNYGDYLILGRNNFDLNNILDDKLNYLTVHKSKGLEADNVIIINLENNIYGFPNKMQDSEIEKVLFCEHNRFKFDEERRLFYVALTRTKNYVFLFVNKKNSSIFIEELINDYNIEILSL